MVAVTANVSPASLDPVRSMVSAYRSVTDEVDCALEALEGQVPAGLRGKLYRNGAGKVEVEGTPQMHPFDGDGMVSRFEIGPHGIRYRNRYVQTRELLEERRAGRMRYRAFGTNLPGGLRRNLFRMRFKNAANTSVVWHGGRLLALWEGGQPHAIDSDSLATLGRFDYHGRLQNRLPSRLITPELPFSAHPKVCPRSGDLFNFGVLVGPTPVLMVYRSPASGATLDVRRFPLSRATFMHDFALTENYLVLFATPIYFDVLRTLGGTRTPVEAISRDQSRSTEVLVIPRSGRALRRFKAPKGFFLFHFFGAYEEGTRVIIHGCRMPDFPRGTVDLRDPEAIRNTTFDPGIPTRWTLDLRTEAVGEDVLDAPSMELPSVDARYLTSRHSLGWGVTKPPLGPPVFTGLGRLNFEQGKVRSRDFGADLPGEPLFVPRSSDAGEGEGWLLSIVYRAETRKSELWILDATTLDTVARYGLPHHQPPGFHGCFVRD